MSSIAGFKAFRKIPQCSIASQKKKCGKLRIICPPHYGAKCFHRQFISGVALHGICELSKSKSQDKLRKLQAHTHTLTQAQELDPLSVNVLRWKGGNNLWLQKVVIKPKGYCVASCIRVIISKITEQNGACRATNSSVKFLGGCKTSIIQSKL